MPTPHKHVRFAISLVACLLTAAPSRAALADGNDVAKIHFLSGSNYYKQGRYLDALREFEEANRISNRAALLYNIALCLKQLTRYVEASQSLREYLRRTPDAADRAVVTEEIAALDRLAAPPPPTAIRSEAFVPPPARAPAPAPAAITPAHPAMSSRRIATWSLGAGGVGLVIAALGTGLGGHGALSALDPKCTSGQRPCTPAEQSQRDAGQRMSNASYALAGIGVAAVGTAVGLYLTERRHPSPESSVLLLPIPSLDGGALVLSGRF